MSFNVARTILVNAWDDTTRQNAKAFWAKKSMRFADDELNLAGKRGNLLLNAFAPDPTLMAATIVITSLEPTKIDCILSVSTLFQVWSEWDTTAFELEMDIFENYLATGDPKDLLWNRYLRVYRTHYWLVNFTFGLYGFTMSRKEKEEFRPPRLLANQETNCSRSQAITNEATQPD